MSRLVDYESFKSNPFTLEKDGKYFSLGVVSKGHAVDFNTGLIIKDNNQYTELDKKPFVKLFNEGLPIIQELKSNAVRVLLDILMDLKKEEDEVYINTRSLAKKHGLSNTRDILSGIKELLDKDIICRKAEKDMYFINVRLIFNGNRVKYNKNRNK